MIAFTITVVNFSFFPKEEENKTTLPYNKIEDAIKDILQKIQSK